MAGPLSIVCMRHFDYYALSSQNDFWVKEKLKRADDVLEEQK